MQPRQILFSCVLHTALAFRGLRCTVREFAREGGRLSGRDPGPTGSMTKASASGCSATLNRSPPSAARSGAGSLPNLAAGSARPKPRVELNTLEKVASRREAAHDLLRFLGHFYIGFASPDAQLCRGLSTNDFASFALPMAMQPSSKSSAAMPDFSNSGRADSTYPMNLQWAKASATKSRAADLLQQVIHRRRRRQKGNRVVQHGRSSIDHLIGYRSSYRRSLPRR